MRLSSDLLDKHDFSFVLIGIQILHVRVGTELAWLACINPRDSYLGRFSSLSPVVIYMRLHTQVVHIHPESQIK